MIQNNIGIIDFEQFLQPGTEPDWFKGLSRYLPKDIEILDSKTGLDVLDFIKNHKRLVILDSETPSVGEPMIYGEVTYWEQCTGGIAEEIIVLGTHTQDGEAVATEVLKCLHKIV